MTTGVISIALTDFKQLAKHMEHKHPEYKENSMSTKQMTNAKGTAVAPPADDRVYSFVPFGAKEEIGLTVATIRTFIAGKTKKGYAPSDVQCLKFIMLCKARALNPWEGDAFLVGYDNEKEGPTFSLITAHQAFLKRAEGHPSYDGMESGVIVLNKDGDEEERQGDFLREGERLLGGWAKVHRKDRKVPKYERVELKVYYKDNPFWKRDPAGMIVKTAESHSLSGSFPNTLGGMVLEEDWGAAGTLERSQMAEATRGKLEALNARLSDEPHGGEATPPPPADPSQSPAGGSPEKEAGASPAAPKTDLTPATKDKITALFKKSRWTAETFENFLKDYDAGAIDDLTEASGLKVVQELGRAVGAK
jgi:phage recombination protein Bet